MAKVLDLTDKEETQDSNCNASSLQSERDESDTSDPMLHK